MILYSTTVGSQPYWLAAGDFNNDQRLDLIVANQSRDNIGILLGYDYATFQNQQTYSNQFSLRPSSIIARDFNYDTYLDILLLHLRPIIVLVFFWEIEMEHLLNS
jgi:hypothetical protein